MIFIEKSTDATHKLFTYLESSAILLNERSICTYPYTGNNHLENLLEDEIYFTKATGMEYI